MKIVFLLLITFMLAAQTSEPSKIEEKIKNATISYQEAVIKALQLQLAVKEAIDDARAKETELNKIKQELEDSKKKEPEKK